MIYFKQYGEQRTGTNYLKRLIELNFAGVSIFASILGWKHGMYETGNGYRGDCNSHEDWVWQKTIDGIVHTVDNYKLRHTPEALLEACPQLNYLISIKNPYSFVLSFKKFRRPRKTWDVLNVEPWITGYFSRYATWLDLEDVTVISFEDLLTDYTLPLDLLHNKFNLTKKNDTYINEAKVVKASTDHGIMVNNNVDFNSDYYLKGQYLQELPDSVIKSITDMISSNSEYMSLMERFNYEIIR